MHETRLFCQLSFVPIVPARHLRLATSELASKNLGCRDEGLPTMKHMLFVVNVLNQWVLDNENIDIDS